MKYKVGDIVVLKGTKEGKTDYAWKIYFGTYGIKKGDVVEIIECKEKSIFNSRQRYYVKSYKKNNPHGFLYEEDFEPLKESWNKSENLKKAKIDWGAFFED